MDDLVAFLAARLDEDEAVANAAQAPAPWKAAVHESDTWIVTDATGEPLIYDEGTPSLEESAHIARHDPARVLREVWAKRKIIEVYEAAAALNDPATDHSIGMATLRMVLRSYAIVWSDHPDCRPEWKP
jgi:Family of unknown function (DUF6221)